MDSEMYLFMYGNGEVCFYCRNLAIPSRNMLIDFSLCRRQKCSIVVVFYSTCHYLMYVGNEHCVSLNIMTCKPNLVCLNVSQLWPPAADSDARLSNLLKP